MKLKIALENKKRPKRSQMAKFIFRGQARKKKAKFELFGLQEANLATLCRTEKFKKSFFPSTILLWNTLDIDIRNSTSLSNFKLKINKIYRPLCYNKWLNFSLTRKASVLHTRLRLGFCALNDYLYRIVVILLYCICCHQNETVKHYLLLCPRFAAHVTNFLPLLHKFMEKHG